MEPESTSVGVDEANEVVDDELVEVRQQERLVSERCAVERFALLVGDSLLDDRDAELRSGVIDFVLRLFKIAEEAVDRFLQSLAGYLLPVAYAACVVENLVPVGQLIR